MKEVNIPVHSFVDLITNSSSEVFACPTDKTKELVYGIVDELLKAKGLNVKAHSIVDVMFYCKQWDGETDSEIDVFEGDPNYSNTGQTYMKVILSPEYQNIEHFTTLLVQLVESIEGVEKYS